MDEKTTYSLETLADHLDAEVRNAKKGMTLGFLRSVDADAETLTFAPRPGDGLVTRSADSVLTLLNGPGSWVVYDGPEGGI